MHLRFRAMAGAAATAALLAIALVPGTAGAITLTPLGTPFNTPIGIDYHQPSNKLVMSVNYPSGEPNNFELVAADGSRTPFSAVHGLTDELKIGSVRSSSCQGGFAAGELFTGNGVPGQIVRIGATGAPVLDPWVTLPGENGLMRGGLFQDRYCVAGGDLIVVTTVGNVWRITSAGVPTKLASLGVHLEGVTTIPNDPGRYGPWAGKILTGAEQQGLYWTIDPTNGAAASFPLGVAPEDVDLIPANENFFGVNFGGGQLMGANASEFCGMRGDILGTQESPGNLYDIKWNGSTFVVTLIASVPQWEHVTFAPAGLAEIPAPPQATINDVTVNEGAGTATFTVSLDRPVSGVCPDPVKVDYATADGTAQAPGDYTAQSGSLTFGPGEQTKTITVPIIDDNLAEGTENFFVNLSNPQGATLADAQGKGTIVDNDDTKVSINDVSVLEGDTGTTPATFTVTLAAPRSSTSSVNYTTSNGTATAPADYVPASGTVTFAPGETSKQVTVLVKGDFIDEPNETFFVDLSSPTGLVIDDGHGVGTIIDDDRNGTFSCRASGLRVSSLLEPVVANPPDKPCRDDAHSLLTVNLVSGLLSTRSGVVDASTDSTPDNPAVTDPAPGDGARAHADAANVNLLVGLTPIFVRALQSDAAVTCRGGVPVLSSSSQVAGLLIPGRAVIDGQGSAVISVGLATVYVNRTIVSPGRITQRALEVDLLGSPAIIVGEATANFEGNPCTGGPPTRS
jgi:hypothetical protein